MRRRTTSLTTICLVALAAFLSSACVLVVDHGPDRDAQFHFSSRGLADRFEVWVDGSVTFSDDDTSVARIAPGGFLHIEERLAFRTRRVTVEPAPSGGVQVTHTVNGRSQRDDEESRDELARLFLQVIRVTALDAEPCVGRILAERGVDGVLDELAHIEGSRATSRYLTALVQQGNLDAADLAEVADRASDHISSSGTRAEFLVAALPAYLVEEPALDAYFDAVTSISSSASQARVLAAVLANDPDRRTLVRVLGSVRSISSSGSKTRVLLAAAARYENGDDVGETFFAAVNSISSSSDRARALLALLDQELDRSAMVSLLRSARRISSSSSKTRVLLAAVTRYQNDDSDIRGAFFDAVDSVSSSSDRASALVAVLGQELDRASMVSLLESARRLSSGGAKVQVLTAAVAHYRTNDDDVREAFFRAVDSISSSSGRARTLVALLDLGNLDTSSIVRLTRSTRNISSTGDKARVLIATVPSFVNEPTPRDAFLDAASSISSSRDQARVLLRLLAAATLDDTSVAELLRSSRGITSSGDKARVLIAAANRVGTDAVLLSVYEEVARSISSSGDRRRALAAVGLTRSEV